ncbi:Sugar-transfer associated ATP-grasp [Halogranum amylolyticum]|uniref:Sugar-transfer associated ATP-grasp n=1 Tax=Halogranum amylolyticum TaxID=660520 RepID=A0A1H8MPQ9_9EURY|nr:sugar-transfer associated ATP-grasp domain-containing protein [Halogranum amylolyticum]SEO19233.1 Sugar-transfer associated ATP-grasp [Halogranum amylolyticum]
MAEHPLLAKLYHGADDQLSLFARLLKYELKWGRAIDVSLKRRLWLWRRGFTSESDLLFDIDETNAYEFLSTVQQERSMDIANNWTPTASNKLTSHLLYSSVPEYLPDLYGLIENGMLKRMSPILDAPAWQQQESALTATDGGQVQQFGTFEWIDTYLDEQNALVLKPVYGRAGNGIFVCRKDADSNRYEVNGEQKTQREFITFLEGLDEYLATEFIEQADYTEQLFPDASNTLRVMTFWDYETDEPFIGAAVQRIGSFESAPTDNWSNGGISAEVTEDGTLSRGAQWLSSAGDVRWFDTHPDTGSQIAGTSIPNWSTMREQILELASLYPYFPKVGWDILPTGDGTFKLIELNPRAGTRSIQIHTPLLRDPRIRQFYDHHDCL